MGLERLVGGVGGRAGGLDLPGDLGVTEDRRQLLRHLLVDVVVVLQVRRLFRLRGCGFLLLGLVVEAAECLLGLLLHLRRLLVERVQLVSLVHGGGDEGVRHRLLGCLKHLADGEDALELDGFVCGVDQCLSVDIGVTGDALQQAHALLDRLDHGSFPLGSGLQVLCAFPRFQFGELLRRPLAVAGSGLERLELLLELLIPGLRVLGLLHGAFLLAAHGGEGFPLGLLPLASVHLRLGGGFFLLFLLLLFLDLFAGQRVEPFLGLLVGRFVLLLRLRCRSGIGRRRWSRIGCRCGRVRRVERGEGGGKSAHIEFDGGVGGGGVGHKI